MAGKKHNPEVYEPNADDFNAATVAAIAARAKAAAEAKSVEPLDEEETVLLADLARRLRPSGFDLVSFAVRALDSTPGAVRYPEG